MQFVIWGAGAMGGTLGAYLVQAGHDIIFVDNVPEHVAAINESGIRITGPIDEFSVKAPAFTPETLEGKFETIFLCTKSHHTRQASEMLLPFLKDDGFVVSIQNGLNEMVISEVVGKERTVGAFVNFGADYMEPGVIHFGGRGAVVLGEIDGKATPRIEALHKVFLAFDENSIITDNIWGNLWSKEAYGAMLFATALTNESIADCLADTNYRSVYMALASEMLSVAKTQDIKLKSFNGFDPSYFLPGGNVEDMNKSLDALVAFNRRSAKTHSGIWRDLAVRKRRTEIGEYEQIMLKGEQMGVAMPVTKRLVELIRDIEEGRRVQSMETLDALKESVK
jgi:2-dehydropantoate 2-reductase